MIETFFLADVTSHLKVNGEYLGIVSNNLKKCYTKKSNYFYEFLPVNDNFNICYGDCNAKSVKVFDFLNRRLVCPVFSLKTTLPFKILFQKQISVNGILTTLTAVTDGCVKFYVDGILNDVGSLPFIPSSGEIYFYQNHLVVEFSNANTALFIYNINTKEKVFSDIIKSYELSTTLTVSKEFKNATKTTTIEEWNLSTFSLLNRRDEKRINFFDLKPFLLPLAFFENVLIGASVSEIVTPSFNEKILSVKDFLGDIVKVIPSPTTKNECWLITNNGVTVCRLEYQNRLISNIVAEDY